MIDSAKILSISHLGVEDTVYVSQLNDLFFLFITHDDWIIQSQRF